MRNLIVAFVTLVFALVPFSSGAQFFQWRSHGILRPSVTSVSSSNPSSLSALSALVAGMDEGEWYQIPNSDLNDVLTTEAEEIAIVAANPGSSHFWGQTGSDAMLKAWCGWAYDDTGFALYVSCGGHADYGGNEVYKYDLTKAGDADAWTRLMEPAPLTTQIVGGTDDGEYIPDPDTGGPPAVHTYDGLVWSNATSSVWRPCGWGFNSPLYGGYGNSIDADPKAAWEFDPATASWSYHTLSETANLYHCGTVYLPDTEQVLVFISTAASPSYRYADLFDADGTETQLNGGAKLPSVFGATKNAIRIPSDAPAAIAGHFIVLDSTGIQDYTLSGTTISEARSLISWPTLVPQPATPEEMGFAWNSQDERVYAWDGARKVYRWEPVGDTWDTLDNTDSTAAPSFSGSGSSSSRIFSKWTYIPEVGAFVGIWEVTDGGIWIYKPPTSAEVLTTFDVTSTSTGDKVVKTAVELAEGATEAGEVSVDVANSQVNVINTWPDGSPRIVSISMVLSLTADTPLTVSVYNVSQAEGSALTTSDLTSAITAMGETSVQFGSLGTITLSDLTGSPDVWVAGPEMIEAVYRDKLTGDDHLSAEFHVQLWETGKIRVREVATNGFMTDGKTYLTANSKTYVPTFKVDGSTVYNNGGASVDHPGAVSYDVLTWVDGDPGVTVRHNMGDLRLTKMIPPYVSVTADEDALDGVAGYGLNSGYVPLEIGGSFGAGMGAAGSHSWIGLMKNEDALDVISDDDPRAQAAVFAAARAINSFPIDWIDPTTLEPITPTDYSTWTLSGVNGTGAGNWSTDGVNTYDIAHHPSAAYLAFLLTADPYYWRTQINSAAACWLSQNHASGDGTDRIFTSQDRGIAWCARTLAQTVAASPDGNSIAAEYKTLLASNFAWWAGDQLLDTSGATAKMWGIGYPGMNTSGYFFSYNANPTGLAYTVGTAGAASSFMFDFWVSAIGHVKDLHVLTGTDETNLDTMIAWMGHATVGMLGGDGDGYCFTEGSSYKVAVSVDNVNDPTKWLSDWADIYTYTDPGDWPAYTNCGNTLLGDSSAQPTSAPPAYWDQKVAAIAYMDRYGVTGAAAAWSRLTGATNWSDVWADCDVYPLFCLQP